MRRGSRPDEVSGFEQAAFNDRRAARSGVDAPNRTRFLAELDTMLATDRRGAIDDMLQVLCERGAIKQAYATVSMNDHYLHESTADGYRESMKRDAATRIGHLLLDDGVLKLKEAPESPGRTVLTGSVFFVVPRKV